MLTVLLAVCCGLINTGRGRGKDSWFHWGMKEFTYLSIALSGYTLVPVWWFAILLPIPECIFWWLGTGKSMKAVLSWFHLPIIPESTEWAAFECARVFVWFIIATTIAQWLMRI